jgi:hypothetical protein
VFNALLTRNFLIGGKTKNVCSTDKTQRNALKQIIIRKEMFLVFASQYHLVISEIGIAVLCYRTSVLAVTTGLGYGCDATKSILSASFSFNIL